MKKFLRKIYRHILINYNDLDIIIRQFLILFFKCFQTLNAICRCLNIEYIVIIFLIIHIL